MSTNTDIFPEHFAALEHKAGKINFSDIFAAIQRARADHTYDYMWVLAQKAIPEDRSESLKNIKLVLHDIFKEFYHLQGDSLMPDFLNGMAYFLHHQNCLNTQEVGAMMQGQGNAVFMQALLSGQNHLLPILAGYRESTKLVDYVSYFDSLDMSHGVEKLETLLDYCTAVNFKNSELLRHFIAHRAWDFPFIDRTIQKHGLDINATGQWVKVESTSSGSFAQGIFIVKSSGSFLVDFLSKYSKAIDLDVQAQWKGKDFGLVPLLVASTVEEREIMNRLTLLLTHCPMSEKHISQIESAILTPKVVATHYEHPVYENLFKHVSFNTPLFDRGAVLHKILMMDHNSAIKDVVSNNKGTISPTVVLLTKFFEHANPEMRHENHPFIVWATQCYMDGLASMDTLNFLYDRYKDELASWTAKEQQAIPSMAKDKLNYKDFKFPPKQPLFKWPWSKREPVAPEVIESPKQPLLAKPLPFNRELFALVKDEELKRHIDSIILNAEQHGVLIGTKALPQNQHYMTALLPKFLNSTIENYLHFATLSPGEARNNVLVHLKLLNKKTYEVLSEGLEQAQDSIAYKEKVHSKHIKSY